MYRYASIVLIFLSCSFIQSDKTPPLNAKIVKYVSTVIGKKVDRGECWDLAYQALTRYNAAWDGKYKYGRKINYHREKIYPGDIIQFSRVQIKYKKGNAQYVESYPHHTSIVYEMLGKHKFKMAHQNNGFSKRKVGVSEFDIANITKGKITIYRPVAK